MSREKYDPATEHDLLIDVPALQGGVSEVKKKYDRSVAFGACSQCSAAKPIGLVRQGDHLVWRHHTRTLGSGVRIECPAVGAPVCECPARPQPGVTAPTCACGVKAA